MLPPHHTGPGGLCGGHLPPGPGAAGQGGVQGGGSQQAGPPARPARLV